MQRVSPRSSYDNDFIRGDSLRQYVDWYVLGDMADARRCVRHGTPSPPVKVCKVFKRDEMRGYFGAVPGTWYMERPSFWLGSAKYVPDRSLYSSISIVAECG